MDKSSTNIHPGRPLTSRMTPRKERERGPAASPRSHRQKPVKTSQVSEASRVRKEKTQREKTVKDEETEEQEVEVKPKSTVVDIDRVREEVKEENLGLLEAAEQEDGLKRKSLGVFEWLLMVFVLAVVLLFLPFSIWFCVKVVREHERAVVFRLGHLLRGRPKGPGLLFYLPLLDVCHKVDVRLKMLKVPAHTVVTKDLVRPELSAVCYYQIENVALCSTALFSLTTVLQTLVQAVVRDVLAQHTLSHILLHRRNIGLKIQAGVDAVACRWGVRVERTDIDELSFPAELQQSLAEAEAKRQKQAKAAEGERDAWEGFRASLRLLQPALVLPIAPDLLSVTPDLASLPLPPPPPPEGEERETEGETETDSPMM